MLHHPLAYNHYTSTHALQAWLSKCGFFREAIDMFATMNVKPNCNTLVSVISACSGLRSLKFGKAIHGYSLRIFHEDNVILENAVLDFYVRCSLAVNGYGKLALQLFSLMIVNLVRPDDITFTGLLSACSHGGMVDEGFMIFKAMSVYKIDMYSRAGHLEEAVDQSGELY
ncbi:hypothetical protein EZV62_018049 [Acer yangbiense]|uniref:Pentatricopeptide repeat-containing protein n=1 Tax=Acer yangbiense TaxID=1000413 RepID=A0A5C7HKG0_9ROSI|nr:hypothetical protein EZV62_018049 [Acer yangbiense]